MNAFRILITCIFLSCAAGAACAASDGKMSLFPLSEVRLLDSPFKHAQELDLAYIMALDPDRLAAPFLREAGLPVKEKGYGNWEGSGLGGHMGGHYMTALSLAYASTGDEQYRKRLDYFLGELKRAQDANGNGYIGGVPNGKALWKQVAAGDIHANGFSINDRWVPWYNLHKTYAGLRDAYQIGGSTLALDMLKALGKWTIDLTKNLSDEQIQQMLVAEQGGMNEVLADYYSITQDPKYLQLAKRFSDRRILEPLLKSEDKLNGLHANTQIPKVIGFARISELDGDRSWFNAAKYFWHEVVDKRSVAFGGNSVSEHFNDKDNFRSMITEVEGPETCNTYNMLKLTEDLYRQQADPSYINFYERALYNHILASQNPDTGGLVYFTPVRPEHYRVYSQVDKAMWCCVGTGIENHQKYGEFIYAHRGKALYVNLFIPSRLNWKERGVVLRQENAIPDRESSAITVEKGGRFELNLRVPPWLSGDMVLTLNGRALQARHKGGYLRIKRHWQAGDRLEFTLPMKTYLEQLPDHEPYYAVLHGPVVLSAPIQKKDETLNYFADDSRMGHVPSGPLCPLVDAPMFVSKSTDVLDKIKRVPGDLLEYVAPDLIGNTKQKDLVLVPFFRVHDTRYMMYWRMGSADDIAKLHAAEEEKEKAQEALRERTVDQVTPGEQQPEVEHGYKGEATDSGINHGRHWRHSSKWFSYQLSNPKQQAKTLRLTLFGADSGRTFKVILNGIVIDTITTDGSAGQQFYDREYTLPSAIQKAKTIEFKLEAAPGSFAGGLYDVRLLK